MLYTYAFVYVDNFEKSLTRLMLVVNVCIKTKIINVAWKSMLGEYEVASLAKANSF